MLSKKKAPFKTLLFFILFIGLLSNQSFAENEGRTIFTSVKAAGVELPEDKWNEIKIKSDQSITFNYKAEGLKADPSKMFFKVFLNGKIHETKTAASIDKFITFSGLNEGIYIVSIQAYTDKNAEAVSAALKFEVSDKEVQSSVSSSSEISGKQAVVNGSSASSQAAGLDNPSYLLYGVIIVFVIQIIVIVVLIRRKRIQGNKLPAAAENQEQTVKSESEILRQENERLKKDNDLLKSYNALHAEYGDLEYSYDKLKKEFTSLKETNDFLKQQINALKSNIADLETANAQLALQKDKLLESKRQLEELQSQKDELFAIAVHDIKNPASAIRAYVELLESYDLNAHEQQEVMQSLVNTSSHIINLAQQMSLVVAKKKPEPMFHYEPGSIKKIADSVCNRNLGYSIKKEVKLINQTSPNTPQTSMDVSKIEEVIDNLVNNAIKYAPKGTVVQVKSYFSDSKITLEVIDNGVGLSEEDCKHVFEKGVLLTPKPTDGETRSGLGLWIVKKIIEDHGGNVWVKSKLGIGSTFAFDLPIKK